MSILNSKFDILRGWPNGSAVAEDFVFVTPDGNNDPLVTGTWVRLDSTVDSGYSLKKEERGNKNACVIVNNPGENAPEQCVPELWGLVIEGTDEYSADQAGRVTVLLGGGYVVRLWNSSTDANHMFTDDAHLEPGSAVTIVGGKIKAIEKDAGVAMDVDTTQVIGWVLKDDSTANSTIDIFVR